MNNTDSKQCLQFKNDAHRSSVIECVVELNQPRMVQERHDLHLPFDIPSVFLALHGDCFGCQLQPGLLLFTIVNGAKFSSEIITSA